MSPTPSSSLKALCVLTYSEGCENKCDYIWYHTFIIFAKFSISCKINICARSDFLYVFSLADMDCLCFCKKRARERKLRDFFLRKIAWMSLRRNAYYTIHNFVLQTLKQVLWWCFFGCCAGCRFSLLYFNKHCRLLHMRWDRRLCFLKLRHSAGMCD